MAQSKKQGASASTRGRKGISRRKRAGIRSESKAGEVTAARSAKDWNWKKKLKERLAAVDSEFMSDL